MKSGTYIRIVMMVVALAAVLWLIRSLNKGAMDKAFDALGLQPGEERLNLCPTKIVAFVWNPQIQPARRAIEERQEPGGTKTQWWAVDSKPHEINNLEIEKWLASHCQVTVHPIDEKAVAAISARLPLEIRHADGSSVMVDEISRQYFKFGDRYFESPDLANALRELRATARFEPGPVTVPAKVAPVAPAEGENQQNPQ